MSTGHIIGVVVLVTLIYIYTKYCDEIDTFLTRKKVCNELDQRCYDVVGKYGNPKEASIKLAQLNKFGIDLMRHLRNKYVYKESSCHECPAVVKFLLSNYNPDTIIENAPTSDVNTSYVDDKGKEFAVCLREKFSGNNQIHQDTILKFVFMHEMAHMATQSYGHEDEFWINFKFLEQEAENANLYTPVNFEKSPVNYCSLDVDYNPYYDIELPNLS